MIRIMTRVWPCVWPDDKTAWNIAQATGTVASLSVGVQNLVLAYKHGWPAQPIGGLQENRGNTDWKLNWNEDNTFQTLGQSTTSSKREILSQSTSDAQNDSQFLIDCNKENAAEDWSNACWDTIPANDLEKDVVSSYLEGIFGYYDFYTKVTALR